MDEHGDHAWNFVVVRVDDLGPIDRVRSAGQFALTPAELATILNARNACNARSEQA